MFMRSISKSLRCVYRGGQTGSDRLGQAGVPLADAPNEGTPDSARECPRVTGVYEMDNATARFAAVSSKPSDELELSTPWPREPPIDIRLGQSSPMTPEGRRYRSAISPPSVGVNPQASK